MSARRAIGVMLALVVSGVACASGYFAWRDWRLQIGLDEAAPNLERFAQAAADAYVRRGHLCASSRVTSSDPMSMWASNTRSKRTQRQRDEEIRDDAGFGCLGVDLSTLVPGRDGYVYTSTGDTFVVQAFRAYLFDPDGTLPRFERRGRVVDGHVEVDPHLYRVAPGGADFPGHPTFNGCSFCEDDI